MLVAITNCQIICCRLSSSRKIGSAGFADIQANFRGQGVFKALYRHIYDQALASSNVIGLRLYVENSNLRAQQTYQALGMKPGGYSVLEELWLHSLHRQLNCHDESRPSSIIRHLPFAISHLPSVTFCPILPPVPRPRFPATPSARHSTAGSDRDDWRRRPGAPRDQ